MNTCPCRSEHDDSGSHDFTSHSWAWWWHQLQTHPRHKHRETLNSYKHGLFRYSFRERGIRQKIRCHWYLASYSTHNASAMPVAAWKPCPRLSGFQRLCSNVQMYPFEKNPVQPVILHIYNVIYNNVIMYYIYIYIQILRSSIACDILNVFI